MKKEQIILKLLFLGFSKKELVEQFNFTMQEINESIKNIYKKGE